MTLENENGFLNPTTKQNIGRNKSMIQKIKEKERVEAGKVVVCPKCGRTEFAVVFTGQLVLNTANEAIGIWDTDHMESVGLCTYCETKVNIENE